MTVIAGLVRHGRIYMGGDSSGVAGWDLTLESSPKVFRIGEFLIGFTSSFRMGQLLEHALEIPPLEGAPTSKYMVNDFVGAVRSCLKNGGALEKEKEIESGGQFLVGCRGRLFRINPDFGVTEPQCRFDAVGCGSSYAIGAISAMEHVGIVDGLATVQAALVAAEKNSCGVRGPMVVITDHDLEDPSVAFGFSKVVETVASKNGS